MTTTIVRHQLNGGDINEDTLYADCPDCRASRGYTAPRTYAPGQAYWCAGCNSEWHLAVPRPSAHSLRSRVLTLLFVGAWLSGVLAILLAYLLVYVAIVVQGHYGYWTGLGITLAIAWACLMTWIIWGQLLTMVIGLGERVLHWILGEPVRSV